RLTIFSSYRVKERSANAAAPAAAVAERATLRIAQFGKSLVITPRCERGVMKFVAAHARAFGAKHAVGQNARRAVTEMQFAFGKAGRMTEQAGHRVVASIGIFDTLAQNHVAAALAMHRTRRGEAAQAFGKTSRCRDRIGMQFGVTTGQPAAIGALWRRFIGQRRK